ncbi:hypothetical protein L1887_00553 [Cichorium endivia]|nr:hypothetical protein L1887_00553 [Cichorium endivia]
MDSVSLFSICTIPLGTANVSLQLQKKAVAAVHGIALPKCFMNKPVRILVKSDSESLSGSGIVTNDGDEIRSGISRYL